MSADQNTPVPIPEPSPASSPHAFCAMLLALGGPDAIAEVLRAIAIAIEIAAVDGGHALAQRVRDVATAVQAAKRRSAPPTEPAPP